MGVLFSVSNALQWGDEVHIHVAYRNGDALHVVEPLTFCETRPGAELRAPAMRLQRSEAQDLMDRLCAVGVRPSEGAGSVGQLAAVQSHLQDMRRMVFDYMLKEK